MVSLHSSILAITTFCLCLPAVAQTPCTPVPDLLNSWRQNVIRDELRLSGAGPADAALLRHLRDAKAHTATLPNPFIKIAQMSVAERKVKGEIVLWEDDALMVLADQPLTNTPHALVIPKKAGIWMPIDADDKLLSRLAMAAARTSDSFIRAAGLPCGPRTRSDVFINTPNAIGIQQLHVHVVPAWSVDTAAAREELYSITAAVLDRQLSDEVRPRGAVSTPVPIRTIGPVSIVSRGQLVAPTASQGVVKLSELVRRSTTLGSDVTRKRVTQAEFPGPANEALRRRIFAREPNPYLYQFDSNSRDVRIESMNDHLFGRMVDRTTVQTGLLRDKGFALPSADPMQFASAAGSAVSTRTFYKLVSSLRSMSMTKGQIIDPTAVYEHAVRIYKTTGWVPIGVIDMEFESLGTLDGTKVGVDSRGRFIGLDVLPLRKHELVVAAPLLEGVFAKTTSVVVVPETLISNRKPRRELTIKFAGQADKPLAMNKPVKAEIGDGALAFTVQAGNSPVKAFSWLQALPLGGEPADLRRAVLRPAQQAGADSDAAQGTKRKVLYALGPTVPFADFTIAPNEPGCGGIYEAHYPIDAQGNVTTTSQWSGYEMGVWLSDLNRGKPREQYDIDPLFILGGQDLDTNEPQALFNQLQFRLGPEAIAVLRSRFDIFVLSYWTDGIISGDNSEPRAIGLRRPIMENADLLVDALHFAYCDLKIKKKAALIGISMGGIVSNAAFLIMEHGSAAPQAGNVSVGGIRPQYRKFPGAVATTNDLPIRLWITIDAPHTGAHIPLGLQELVSRLEMVPDVGMSAKLLDGQSSRELLLEHHSKDTRTASSERGAFLNSMAAKGGFPKTIGCTVAIASGSWSLPRPYLWKMGADGMLPTTPENLTGPLHPSDPNLWDLNWYAPDSASIDRARNAGDFMSGYKALAPGSLPMMVANVSAAGVDTNQLTVNISLSASVSEGTFQEFMFPEVAVAYRLSKVDIPNWEGHFDAYAALQANGAVSVKVPVLGEVEFPFKVTQALVNMRYTRGYAPLGLSAGGYRPTVEIIAKKLTEAFSDGLSLSQFVPRHSFIPTRSALFLDSDFLERAWQHASATPEWRQANVAGGFNEMLDLTYMTGYLPAPIVSENGSGGVWPKASITVPRGVREGAEWRGKLSPFDFLVVQEQARQHTFYAPWTVEFIFKRLFADNCDPGGRQHPPVIQTRVDQIKNAANAIPQEWQGSLPPMPPLYEMKLPPVDMVKLKRSVGL